MAGSLRITTALSVPTGLLNLRIREGLVFLNGDGVGDGSIRFTGTLAQTRTALGSLAYITAVDSAAPTTLGITIRRGILEYSSSVILAPSENRVVRIIDPFLKNKMSIWD